MKVVIKQLIWDDWNTKHIQKHQVSTKEVEESLMGRFAIFISGHSGRVISLGKSGKRLVTTVMQKQGSSR